MKVARLTHAGHTFGWQKSQSHWPSAVDPAIITRWKVGNFSAVAFLLLMTHTWLKTRQNSALKWLSGRSSSTDTSSPVYVLDERSESHCYDVRAEFCLVFTRVWVINRRRATALKFSHFSTSYNHWTLPLRLTFLPTKGVGEPGGVLFDAGIAAAIESTKY